MSKTRLMLSSTVAVLLVGAVGTSSASAAIKFKWKVGGAELKAGETKEFSASNDSKAFDMHAAAGLGTVLLLATQVLAEPGSTIIGGVPGTGETVIVLKGVTVDTGPNCGALQSGVAGQVKTTPLRLEIVEGASSGTGNNEVDVLFTPRTGTTIATFEFIGAACIFEGLQGTLTGLFLALALPQNTEVLRQDLVFEANTKEYHNSGNSFRTAALSFGGVPATLSGLTLAVLSSAQSFGPF